MSGDGGEEEGEGKRMLFAVPPRKHKLSESK